MLGTLWVLQIAAQCCHATLACFKVATKLQKKLIRQWEDEGQASDRHTHTHTHTPNTPRTTRPREHRYPPLINARLPAPGTLQVPGLFTSRHAQCGSGVWEHSRV